MKSLDGSRAQRSGTVGASVRSGSPSTAARRLSVLGYFGSTPSAHDHTCSRAKMSPVALYATFIVILVAGCTITSCSAAGEIVVLLDNNSDQAPALRDAAERAVVGKSQPVVFRYLNETWDENEALLSSVVAGFPAVILDATAATSGVPHLLQYPTVPFMTLEDVGSVFHAAPNNFIDIRPAARLIATITLRTIEMFGWPSVFPVYRPTGLVSTQYTNTPQQIVTELLGLNSSVTVFDAEVFTSQESIKAVIRSAFANRRRAFLIIGTAADYHQFLSIAAPLAAGFEFLWLCPAYGNQAAMFKELVETNPIANIGESNSLVLPEYQGSFVSTVATSTDLQGRARLFYEMTKLVAGHLPITSAQDLKNKLINTNQVESPYYNFDASGRRIGVLQLRGFWQGGFVEVANASVNNFLFGDRRPRFNNGLDSTSEFPLVIPYFMANTFSSDTILQWRYIADIAAKYIQLNNLIPWQYTMRMFEVETTSNGGQATLNTVDLYNTIEPVAVVGPGRAQVCLDLQNVLGVLRIPHVSPTATATVLSNQALAPSFLRVTPTDYASARIVDHFMKDNNWLHIAFLVSQDEFAGSTDHVSQVLIETSSLKVLASREFIPGNDASIREQLQAIISSEAKVVFVDGGPDSFGLVIEHARDMGMFTSDMVWIFGDQIFFQNETSPAFGLPDGVFALNKASGANSSAQAYLREQWDLFNPLFYPFKQAVEFPGIEYVFDSIITVARAATITLEEGMSIFNTTHYLNAMRRVEFQGASGYISFSGNDRLNGSLTIFNKVNGKWTPICQMDSIGSGSNLETTFFDIQAPMFIGGGYTVPKDLNLYYIAWDGPLGLTFVILAALALLCILGTSVIIMRYQKNKLVRASSPVFLQLVLLGVVLGISSIFPSTGEPTNITCMLKPWLLAIGFSISMASLCAKNFRVYRLLTDSTMKIIKITNFHLLLIVTIVLIPFVAYMLIWTLVDGEQALIVPSRYYCSSNSFLWRVFLGVLAAFLLAAGIILAILTRNIPQLYRECFMLGMATYNMTFCILAGIMTSFFLEGVSPDAAYVLFNVGVLFGFGGMWLILMAPKLWIVLIHPERLGDIKLSSSSRTSGTTMSSIGPGPFNHSSFLSGKASDLVRSKADSKAEDPTPPTTSKDKE